VEAAGFSVGEVAQRVGISASTLRAWERRYDLLRPARSSGGHRRYSREELRRVQRMVELIDDGWSTSAAATAILRGDRELVGDLPTPARAVVATGTDVGDPSGPPGHAHEPPSGPIRRGLRVLRRHLDVDIAFVSQLHDGRREFVFVDAGASDGPIRVGASDPAEESYCQHVVAGRVPQLLIDPARHPVTAGMPATRELPVGTHLSVPIELRDGIYGTCCCFSYEVQPRRDERDLAAVRLFADLVASYLEDDGELASRN
jgi:GAF domain-containing protein